MKLSVPCKNCGGDLEVDEQTINNAATVGTVLSVAHDVCPGTVQSAPNTPLTVKHQYRLQLILTQAPDDPDDQDLWDTNVRQESQSFAGCPALSGAGTTVEAATFAQAVNGPMTEWLNTTWPKLMESAAYAELPLGPATAS